MLAKNQQIIYAMIATKYGVLRGEQHNAYMLGQAAIVDGLLATPEMKSFSAEAEKVLSIKLGYNYFSRIFGGSLSPLTLTEAIAPKTSWAARWLEAQGFDPQSIRFPVPQYEFWPPYQTVKLACQTASGSWAKLQDAVINLSYDLSVAKDIPAVGAACDKFCASIK